MFKTLKISLVILITLLGSLPLVAAELEGVKMEDTMLAGNQTLQLNGQGLRKKFFFRVYVAGLYLPSHESDAEAILKADSARHLTMEMLRSVDGSSLADAWNDCLEANTPNASEDAKEGFQQLGKWMQDTESGDQLGFTYLPGEGTKIKVKGADMGRIAGKDFADALFACWIGSNPPGEDFKAGLLGSSE